MYGFYSFQCSHAVPPGPLLLESRKKMVMIDDCGDISRSAEFFTWAPEVNCHFRIKAAPANYNPFYFLRLTSKFEMLILLISTCLGLNDKVVRFEWLKLCVFSLVFCVMLAACYLWWSLLSSDVVDEEESHFVFWSPGWSTQTFTHTVVSFRQQVIICWSLCECVCSYRLGHWWCPAAICLKSTCSSVSLHTRSKRQVYDSEDTNDIELVFTLCTDTRVYVISFCSI